MPPPTPPLLLSNPYVSSISRKHIAKISVVVDLTENDYFFTHLLAGPIGNKQKVFATLFHKLYLHFQSLGIPAVYDEHGPEIVARELAKLNFESPSGRCADPSPAKSKAKPNPKRESNSRATKGSSEEGKGASRETGAGENPESSFGQNQST